MKTITIRFKNYTATITANDGRVHLLINGRNINIPTKLADILDKSEALEVNETSLQQKGSVKVTMSLIQPIKFIELINVICDAITAVYDCDTVISNR